MNWRRWIRPGLVATLLLAVAALFVRGGGIEKDLDTRVEARLAAQGLDWVRVQADWRDVTLSGTAPSEGAQVLAAEIAGAVAGVREVRNRTGLLPLQEPFTFAANRNGQVVDISGYVPSAGMRDAVLAEARRAFPSAEIRDELALARGAPEAFGPAVAFALDRLAGLAEGKVTLTDATLVVSGTAYDSGAMAEARQAFASNLPPGVTLGPVEILPARAPRFVWSAAVSEGGVLIAGFIPNEAARDIVVEEVRKAFPGHDIADEMIVASGEPDGFLDAVTFAVKALTHLESGGVTLDELTLDLAGTARDVDQYDALLASVADGVPAGMTVVAADLVPATVTDYGWRGEISSEGVALTGYVPTLAERRDLEATAEALFGGRGTIRNEVRVARGGPVIDWVGGVKFAMGELARLDHGVASISGEAGFAIEGVARSSADYAALAEEVGGVLPASLGLTSLDVAPPTVSDFRLVAERDGNELILSGYVADPTRRDEIVAAARRSLPGGRVTDRTAYGGGAPDGFFQAATAGLGALGRLAGGRLTVVAGRLELKGSAFTPAQMAAVETGIAERLPEGFAYEGDIALRQPPQQLAATACNDRLGRTLRSGRLEFVGDSADLAAESLPVFDRLAATLGRCPEARVEIGVHSDADGSRAANERRTQARADALLESLVDASIRRERLTAVGYGESKPIADNDTAAGKAQNRRIEFVLAVADPVPPAELPKPAPPEPEEDDAAGAGTDGAAGDGAAIDAPPGDGSTIQPAQDTGGTAAATPPAAAGDATSDDAAPGTGDQ